MHKEKPMHTEGVVAWHWATDPWRKNWRTCYSIGACTQQATRLGVHDTQRSGLEHVLIYCSLHTGRVAICAAQTRRLQAHAHRALIFTPRIRRSTPGDNAFGVHGLLCFLSAASSRLQCACHIRINSLRNGSQRRATTPRMCMGLYN